jgi:uncharacterized protein
MAKYLKVKEIESLHKNELKSISIEDVKDYIEFYKNYKKEIKEINFESFKNSVYCADDICETLTSDYPDDSHDFHHHVSVKYLAIDIFNKTNNELSQVEKVKCSLLICISSILHDVIDYKYPKNIELKKQIIEEYLKRVYPDKSEDILWIINNISYSKQIKDETKNNENKVINFALKCVTDADRFFAIGLIGIQRCIQYTILKFREKGIEINYENVIKNVIKHSHEKLLLLRDKFNFEYTKNISLKHHELLEEFVKIHENKN